MGHRILIVDGDELHRRSLCKTLESAGFAVNVAVGEDAMGVLEAHAVDLVITERLLRDTDGFSLLWCIKADYPELPVIVMARDREFPVIVEAMRLGADDYLLKPLDTITLLRSVRRAIEARGRPLRPR